MKFSDNLINTNLSSTAIKKNSEYQFINKARNLDYSIRTSRLLLKVMPQSFSRGDLNCNPMQSLPDGSTMIISDKFFVITKI